MRDEPSAKLVIVKAGCLRAVGVICELEKLFVLNQARDVIQRSIITTSRRKIDVFGPAVNGPGKSEWSGRV